MLFIKRYSSHKQFEGKIFKLFTYIDGKKAGYVEYALVGKRLYKVLHTVVNPNYRGAGIGKKLIDLMVQKAKDDEVKLLSACSYATKILQRSSVEVLAIAKDLYEELKQESVSSRIPFAEKVLGITPGNYAEKDQLLGIPVPVLRQKERLWGVFSEEQIQELLNNPIHELRLLALIHLVELYKQTADNIENKEKLFKAYLKGIAGVNNWDLVDVSAPWLIGNYSFFSSEAQECIKKYALSDNLWLKRIAIVATLGRIRKGELEMALEVVTQNLGEKHHLIQKANGWILREIGKVEQNKLLDFLALHRANIPAITKSYATEKIRKK